MLKNRVLVLDIETSPVLAYVWGIRDQYINHDQIKEDWYIMAWCAKWLGEEEVIYKDTRGKKNDSTILEPLWKLLDEADIVITQNGASFDGRKIAARFMLAGYQPHSPYKHLDTYRFIRRVASFTSNKLDYLTHKLCERHQKRAHKEFPGFSLWIECLNGNEKAWEEMKAYNIEDVLSTEELHTRIRAWAPESTPKVFDMTDSSSECGTCGYTGQMREGKKRRAKKYMYKQHSCPKCGSWQPGERVK